MVQCYSCSRRLWREILAQANFGSLAEHIVRTAKLLWYVVEACCAANIVLWALRSAHLYTRLQHAMGRLLSLWKSVEPQQYCHWHLTLSSELLKVPQSFKARTTSKPPSAHGSSHVTVDRQLRRCDLLP